jgi:hypothetical protein
LDFFVDDFSLVINCWENVTFDGGFKRDLQSLLRHVWRAR